MPAIRKKVRKTETPPKAASDSVGAQMAMMRKRTKKHCENPECGKQFSGLAITSYCSDQCRFRAAYLRRKEKEA